MIWLLTSSLISSDFLIPFNSCLPAILVFLPSLEYAMIAVIAGDFNTCSFFLGYFSLSNIYLFVGISPFKFHGYLPHFIQVSTDVTSLK